MAEKESSGAVGLRNAILTICVAAIIGSATSIMSVRMVGAVQAEQISSLRRDLDEARRLAERLEDRVRELERSASRIEYLDRRINRDGDRK